MWIANLRYRDSVEDKVHKVLAERLQAIHDLFGQIPDTLEDVWVKVALNDEAEIAELIDQTTATRHPFRQEIQQSRRRCLGELRLSAQSRYGEGVDEAGLELEIFSFSLSVAALVCPCAVFVLSRAL